MMTENSPGWTALVTGGGGFLGTAIVRMLVERGVRVRSFSRNRYPHLDGLGIEQVQGDLAEAGSVDRACKDVEVVFHTAAKAGVWGPYGAFYRANSLGTFRLIEACREASVSRLVYTSSPSVVFGGSDMAGVDESVSYPERYNTHYQATKAAAEKAVLAAASDDLATVALRPHLIWGPGDPHLTPRILQRAEALRIVGNGTNRVDTVYVDNAARAHLLAADRLADTSEISGRCYFISQGEPIPLWEMINRILEAGGKPPVKKSISFPAAWLAGALLELIYGIFHLPGEPRMTRFLASELAKDHWFDISASRRDLGYEPTVSMEEGMQRLKRWLDSRQEGSESSAA
jgi:nucleoside-diphosphate-sugar epimerase